MGGQGTVVWPKCDLIVGTAASEVNGRLDTAWFKADFFKETSDYGIIISYQDGNDQNYQNLGVTYSKDMLNGIQIHGEYNLRYPDAGSEYLIGGIYTGAKLAAALEYYHGVDNWTIFLSYSQLKIDMENYYSLNPQVLTIMFFLVSIIPLMIQIIGNGKYGESPTSRLRTCLAI